MDETIFKYDTIHLVDVNPNTELETHIKNAIQNFNCKDADVENFLKNKAFDFERRNKSRTYLIFEDKSLVAYYTLSLHSIVFEESTSKNLVKKLDGFSKDVQSVGIILIGQLGKDFNLGKNISGAYLLDECLSAIIDVKRIVGGRYTMLECAEIPKIVKFYKNNGFEVFQKIDDKYLRMIKKL
ncbi:MAG: hypothetical protein FWG68_09355 [Defluviitaleaceae bacterium]|nr:hypothetical protein [Defluviitaleaceae bacterium]